jgi:type VI secretion system protein ImpG
VDFDQLYLDELENLRSLGREFAEDHPTVASYLAGESGDPDIERLLQGFAFLAALVRRKIDDEIPEFIQDVINLVGPDIALPMPALTVLKLGLESKLPNGILVKAKTEFASQKVDDTSCYFQTSWPIVAQPVTITDVIVQKNLESHDRLSLEMSLDGMSLVHWTGDSLSVYLSGSYPEATNFALGLRKRLKSVSIRAVGGSSSHPLSIHFPGLDPRTSLFEVKQTIFEHIRWVRQFLAFPEKALFFELGGFASWPKPPGLDTFIVDFDFENFDEFPVQKISTTSFTLNAVPAANIFIAEGTPINLTHLKEGYLVTPLNFGRGEAQVYEVVSVRGRSPGSLEERKFVPASKFYSDGSSEAYQIITMNGIRADTLDHYIRLPFINGRFDQTTVLSLMLRCTNGRLPERIRLGEINLRTSLSPEKVTVSNATVPVSASIPNMGNDLMWKIVSHARLGLTAITDIDTLKEFLNLYIPAGGTEPSRLSAIRRRVAGIESVRIEKTSTLVRGSLINGSEVTIQLAGQNYASTGDLYTFGCMLAHLFAGVVDLNSFVTVRVHDVMSGGLYEWPKMLSPRQTI